MSFLCFLLFGLVNFYDSKTLKLNVLGILLNLSFTMISPIRVQPSGGRLGISYRPGHPEFESPLEVPLDYLIHNSSR